MYIHLYVYMYIYMNIYKCKGVYRWPKVCERRCGGARFAETNDEGSAHCDGMENLVSRMLGAFASQRCTKVT